MDIRTYLNQAAAEISDRALAAVRSAEDWKRERPRRVELFRDRLGLSPYLEAPRTPLNVRVTGVLERKGYRVEKLYFESLPRLYVSANLYLPAQAGPLPAVLYLCGHSGTQKIHYQSHARRWCQLGFAALVVDTIQFGEIRGDHHGTWSQGRFHWFSRGYSPAGVEIWNAIRALDLLAARPEVDGNRMGVTGTSGGGGMSWFLGAADERVKAVAPSCGTGTLRSHLAERTVDGHCDCMFAINNDLWDLSDIGALIAPRPLLVASAQGDGIYKIEAVREIVARVGRIYEGLGAADRIQLVDFPGPHSYSERTRTHIFSWFLRHLAGREVLPAAVGDLNAAEDEPGEALRVYAAAPPADERVTTIDDEFIPAARPAVVRDAEGLRARRADVVRRLRELSFRHFPDPAPPLDVEINQRSDYGDSDALRFSFHTESGWRLPGRLSLPKSAPQPAGVVLALRSPGELNRVRGGTEEFLKDLKGPWLQAIVETRGTGEAAWGEDLSWHVRRGAAITGRTVASLRVWDSLRALAALRALPGVDPRGVVLAARGEMAPVALYAALLDGGVKAVLLGDPPGTQNEPSQPDGRGPAIEMLSCLRVTDLPEVAGLLWPAELVFVGWRPESYTFSEETYRRLGPPGAVRRLKSLAGWMPA